MPAPCRRRPTSHQEPATQCMVMSGTRVARDVSRGERRIPSSSSEDEVRPSDFIAAAPPQKRRRTELQRPEQEGRPSWEWKRREEEEEGRLLSWLRDCELTDSTAAPTSAPSAASSPSLKPPQKPCLREKAPLHSRDYVSMTEAELREELLGKGESLGIADGWECAELVAVLEEMERIYLSVVEDLALPLL